MSRVSESMQSDAVCTMQVSVISDIAKLEAEYPLLVAVNRAAISKLLTSFTTLGVN